MYCKNCGSEIESDSKFCPKCGNLIEKSHDLDGVTQIATPLFLLYNLLSLSIYGCVKLYRITGDIRKIVPKYETVSPLIITTWLFLYIMPYSPENAINCVLINICSCMAAFLLQIHMVYRTLNNIREIARIKQNKDLKYNKFWALIFGFVYINFVFNTYDQRLIEHND